MEMPYRRKYSLHSSHSSAATGLFWPSPRATARLFVLASCSMIGERGRATHALPRLSLGSVITVGTFDGVHVGHRDLLARVTERAEKAGLPGLLVTFDPHPLEVVNPPAA